MKFHGAARHDGVVTVAMNTALEAQLSKKQQCVLQRPAWQYWDSDVVLLPDYFDVFRHLMLEVLVALNDCLESFIHGACAQRPNFNTNTHFFTTRKDFPVHPAEACAGVSCC